MSAYLSDKGEALEKNRIYIINGSRLWYRGRMSIDGGREVQYRFFTDTGYSASKTAHEIDRAEIIRSMV